MPAMESIVPQLAPRSHLQQANALLSFSRAGLNVLGPTVAALLVAAVGSGWALAFDAATWLAAALLLTRVRSRRPRTEAAACSATCARAGRCSPGTPGSGWWWPASGC